MFLLSCWWYFQVSADSFQGCKCRFCWGWVIGWFCAHNSTWPFGGMDMVQEAGSFAVFRRRILQSFECTQTRVVMLFNIKKCKRLLKYCWRQPELGRPWQIPLVQFAFSAIALCAWISTPKELVCALFALVFLGVVEAIQLVVVCPNHPHISCGTTKTAMKEGGTTCCWRMV